MQNSHCSHECIQCALEKNNVLHGSANVPENPKPKYRYKMNIYQKITFYGLGSVFLLFGLLVSGFWKHIFDHVASQRIILSNSSTSESFPAWESNSIPVYFSIRLFNWTNPWKKSGKKEKPNFVEIGPYVYKFTSIKEDIIWNSNGTITYKNRRQWVFDAALSNGSESDLITNINPVPVIIAEKMKYFPRIAKVTASFFITYNENWLSVTHTVKDLLFDGCEDKLLHIASKLKKLFPSLNVLPERFGWYYGKNFTDVNLFNMFTGSSNVNELGLLHFWNYSVRNPAFEGKCGEVSGSIGDFWPYDAAQMDQISLYIPDFCSNFNLRNGGSHVVNDLQGIMFEGSEFTFDNSSHDPQSSCYCSDNKCNISSGVRNLTNCVHGPVFLSFPHFYGADESYREAITGMHPDEQKHKFHLTLQKDSSVVIDAFARLQVNLYVEPIDGFDFMSDLPFGVIPIFWFEEFAEMPTDLVDRFRFSFNTIPTLLSISGLIFVIIGAILLVVGLILTRMSYQTIPYTVENL